MPLIKVKWVWARMGGWKYMMSKRPYEEKEKCIFTQFYLNGVCFDLTLNQGECCINSKIPDFDICIACLRFLKRLGYFQLRRTFRFLEKGRLSRSLKKKKIPPKILKNSENKNTDTTFKDRSHATNWPLQWMSGVLGSNVFHGDLQWWYLWWCWWWQLDSSLIFLWIEKRPSEVSSCCGQSQRTSWHPPTRRQRAMSLRRHFATKRFFHFDVRPSHNNFTIPASALANAQSEYFHLPRKFGFC